MIVVFGEGRGGEGRYVTLPAKRDLFLLWDNNGPESPVNE
jgi:hypothetical protein